MKYLAFVIALISQFQLYAQFSEPIQNEVKTNELAQMGEFQLLALARGGPVSYDELLINKVKTANTCERVIKGIKGSTIPKAGAFSFELAELAISYADTENETLGFDGDMSELSIATLGALGDNFILALNMGHGIHSNELGIWDHDLSDTFMQVQLLYRLGEQFTFGPFIEYAYIDIDTDAPGLGGSDDVVAAGLSANFVQEMGEQLYLSSSFALASMNKDHFGEVFEDEDTAFAVSLALDKIIEDYSLSLFAYYFTFLDNISGLDGHYWQGSFAAAKQVSDTVEASLEYSTYFESDDYEEDRVTLYLSYRF
ncbi:MAG: hypothetical protein HRT89_20655 [Lentisphaeria bacterium]|nr:hypothetical protein [Lentisphaeria bacterium]NQZ70471.1 hypothetical protein [Lentisphaeria bacterium]